MLNIPVLPGHRLVRILMFFVFVVLLATSRAGIGAPRIIDRIDIETGSESNKIHLYFNIPIRVMSHVMNSTRTELNIQVQPTVTPGTGGEVALSSGNEVLSWKPTAEVPLDKIRFQGRVIGASLLEVSFVTPVEVSIDQRQRDFFSLTISIKNTKPVERIVLPEPPDDEPVSTQSTRPGAARPIPGSPAVPAKVAEGLMVINLSSHSRPIDMSKVSPVPMPEGARLYTTEATVNGRTWYRLRLGFFADAKAAGKALKEIRLFHPKAWIDRATPGEKAQVSAVSTDGATAPSGTPAERRKPPIRLPKKSEDLPTTERLSQMMTTTREVMTEGNYPKAIRMLTAILEQPENRYTQEAQELLGLARERNGQFTHAYAEYEKYLQEYPEGEDAERVKQRLSGLATATKKPQQPLRKPRAEEKASPWEVFGSLAVSYRLDGINSDFTDESITRSAIDPDIFLSARRELKDGDLRLQLTSGYSYDLLSDLRDNETTLIDAYVEYAHRPTATSVRLGRQRQRSSGVWSRFDGLVVGHRFSPDVEAFLSLGAPVDRTSDILIRDDKRFVSLSVALDSIFKNTNLNLFFVEQRSEGLVDRRAVGGELRYYMDDLSVYGLIDYDVVFKELNTLLLQSNWNPSSQTALYLTFDYRLSPALTALNALLGQNVDNIFDLKDLLSDSEIYDLARDRTARIKIFSAGGTQTFLKDIQLSGDFTVSNVDSTPASGGVEATISTGNEFFYTLQVSKPDLIKSGDIGILSLRFSNASAFNTYILSADTRYPVTSRLRINPRLSVSYRESKNEDSNRTTFGARIQGDYRLKRNLLLEGELAANRYNERLITGPLDFTDYYLRAGLRWEF